MNKVYLDLNEVLNSLNVVYVFKFLLERHVIFLQIMTTSIDQTLFYDFSSI